MNTTLRDALAEQIDGVGPADLDIDTLVGLGERRLHRRRLTAALGGAAAVLLVIALAVGGPMLNGSTDHGQGPTDSHTTDGDEQPNKAQARHILYSETHRLKAPPYFADDAFRFGGHVIETDSFNVHMDVTDDGFVYTTDDARLYFTDGATLEQIGSNVCGRNWSSDPMWIGAYEQDSVMTGNAGSLVAWFDCTKPTRGTLVVVDTSTGREVVRQPMSACVRKDLIRKGLGAPCGLTAVVGDHVYVTKTQYSRAGVGLVMFDVTNRHESPVTEQAYTDDITSQPRQLVVGDSPQTGSLTDGIGQIFNVTGARLVPVRNDADPSDPANPELVTTSAFETDSDQALALRLPTGYQSDGQFTLFEWLDDDTVALSGGNQSSEGDILTCRLSGGRCDIAIKGKPGWERLLPQTVLIG
jgi:hypothetical protein